MNPADHTLFDQFSDSMLIAALQTSSDATAIYINEDLLIRFANDAMLSIWGKDKTIIGKTLAAALPELEGQPFVAILQRVWHTGLTYSVSDTPASLVVDGILQEFYFDFEYRAIQDQSGRTLCIIHTTKDVTQRRAHLLRIAEKEAEEQALNEEMAATMEELTSTNEELNRSFVDLADSREKLRTLIAQAPVGICVLQGPEHIIDIANEQILKIWGRTEQDVLGKIHELARPELAGQPMLAWLEKVFQTGEPRINRELRVNLYTPNGTREAVVNSMYQPIRSSRGEITGILCILEEITEQMAARAAHDKNQQMLKMAIEAGELATFYYESATNTFSGNALLKAWFGLSEDEQIDLSNALDVIVSEDRERVIKAISAALDGEQDGHYEIEYQVQTPGQQARTLQALGKVFYDLAGNPTSLNGTLRDVTEQKKDEQRKDDFIGMVSHEMKTPVTSLKAYLQLIKRNAIQNDDVWLGSTSDKALKQIGYMTSMINGFLNVSRLESGKMAIDYSHFDAQELFSELENELSANIHTHRLSFIEGGALPVYGDREKLAQVIKNLAGNAAKYSPVGSIITVGYKRSAKDELVMWVEDQGMGIAEEDQPHIFERYYRVKNTSMGSIAGFGIGLYLCKEIIDRHSGSIEVESEPEKGSLFKVTLPINTQQVH